MPLYEYECPEHGRFERIQPMRLEKDVEYRCYCPTPGCMVLAQSVISQINWHMGWKFLKDKSEKSPPAPTDSGYHPDWDEAYKGPQVSPKASVPL